MKWLELITLRSAGECPGVLAALRMQMAGSDGNPGLVEMKAYRHAALEYDLSVHLHWETNRPERNGSALGHQVANALKELGLVDHSVWVEEKESLK